MTACLAFFVAIMIHYECVIKDWIIVRNILFHRKEQRNKNESI